MREDAQRTGKLEPKNEPYAVGKITGIKLCESYNRQYGQSHGIDYRSHHAHESVWPWRQLQPARQPRHPRPYSLPPGKTGYRARLASHRAGRQKTRPDT
jgi:hypothetical protein